MPLDLAAPPLPSSAPKRIAIIGAGVSGLSAAYYLSDHHRVTVFEAEPRLGGHARTLMAGRRGETPVDTGFMVFNDRNYPRLNALFDDIGAPAKSTNMSFGVSLDDGAFEYGLHHPRRLFADPSNVFRPSFWRMVSDIVRFNARAGAYVDCEEVSLGAALDEMELSAAFRERYLFPLAGAIWSTPTDEMSHFPVATLIRFFRNHALLSATDNPRWRTIEGGSKEYVARLERRLRARDCDIRLAAPVETVTRTHTGVQVKAARGEAEAFDEVVFACHSDQALRLLSDPSGDERSVLGALRYRPNRVVLHADAGQMPRRRACWSSWVYRGDTRSSAVQPQTSFTYWMNLLQDLPADDLLLVTLNPLTDIPDELIYDETVLSHPIYDLAGLEAQKRLPGLQGVRHTWFCGAYAGYGFHEDGVASAAAVADGLNSAATVQAEAAA